MGKIGLVLSGGGAKGAYEAGVVKALIDARIKFDVIAGTSVGGLNAVLIAANQIDDLITVWVEKITNNDAIFVLNGKLKLNPLLLLLPIIFIKGKIIKILSRLGSIVDSSPLQNLLKHTINYNNLKSSGNRLILTGTNLQIGSEETFVKAENGKFFIKRKGWVKEIKEEDFEKMAISATIATSAIPVAFNPEVISGYQYVDGGIGNNTPLLNAIEAGCKDIFTVLIKPPSRTPLDTKFDNLFSIGGRAIEILIESTTEEDFKHAKLINDVIINYQKMVDGIDFILNKVKDKEVVTEIQKVINKSFPFENKGLINNIVVQPDKDIELGLLDFSPEKLKKAVSQGYQDGCKKLEELTDEKLEELNAKRLECVACQYEVGCEGKKIDSKFYAAIDRLIGKVESKK
ncbi:MAG: patatin-like phospholipase family protein [Nitrospirota bacterium]